ncbi:alpha/beta fold hydrolase [Nocardia carnea]|uniref:Alpha/beta fold hydrolase n=1 Tax=Nocardia carnea TaxID=37328 RepID=A0ABW7TRW9_9NOCA|nr:alpha/beta hydrolase [Nocardia carnea]
MSNTNDLGRIDIAHLPTAAIRYSDTGSGPPIVFVHGLLVNSGLWRHTVAPVAAAGYRCLVPDWPLGSHSIPVPDADLTPTGVAGLIADFLDHLDLQNVTIVANDTGGALTQVLLTHRPERIGRVVLAAVDSYESFLPQPFTLLPPLARVPGSVRLITELLRFRFLQRLPIALGWLSKRPIPPETVDSYLRPSRESAAIRADLRRFLQHARRRYTLDAATRFDSVTVPVLVVWAREDRLFPVSYAERLVRDLPDATLDLIDDSYTLIPEDQPELLAGRILEFTRLHATP